MTRVTHSKRHTPQTQKTQEKGTLGVSFPKISMPKLKAPKLPKIKAFKNPFKSVKSSKKTAVTSETQASPVNNVSDFVSTLHKLVEKNRLTYQGNKQNMQLMIWSNFSYYENGKYPKIAAEKGLEAAVQQYFTESLFYLKKNHLEEIKPSQPVVLSTNQKLAQKTVQSCLADLKEKITRGTGVGNLDDIKEHLEERLTKKLDTAKTDAEKTKIVSEFNTNFVGYARKAVEEHLVPTDKHSEGVKNLLNALQNLA